MIIIIIIVIQISNGTTIMRMLQPIKQLNSTNMNLTPRRNSKKATNIKVVDECRSSLFKDPLQNNCQLAIP